MSEELSKEYLDGIQKSVSDVGELLKDAPTKEEIEKAVSGAAELSEKVEKMPTEEAIGELIKAAVDAAVAPLNEKIETLENSKVIKGMQDFDFAKFKEDEGVGGKPEEDESVVKSTLANLYGVKKVE